MIRRLPTYRSAFDDDDPGVFILAPDASRPVPAGDTRRGTAWLWVLDPEPCAGHGNPLAFKAPLEN